MPSLYLQCDCCPATFDGGDKERGIHWSHPGTLIDLARALGWYVSGTERNDRAICPKCLPVEDARPGILRDPV